MQIGNANDFGSADGIATSPCSYNRFFIVIEGPAHPAFAAERPRDDNNTVEALALNDEGQGADSGAKCDFKAFGWKESESSVS